ncbi:IDEAL domain-containing protein [Sporosarcina jiandibaonis]|uniref:IDEAL domain-containing protein n=1 Tax=Sporosarcina jiandibaonis TaxID=2715535 RepID=UPI0015547249|nr:IDEAL domain-containing protein [Sporosarcina jiandibaonis]
MEKKYSYTEFMKSIGRDTSSAQAEKLLNEIYMDLFLKRLHREQIRERLNDLVDQSLDKRDKSKFLKYSKELLKFEECN